jgi:hypothetical protein
MNIIKLDIEKTSVTKTLKRLNRMGIKGESQYHQLTSEDGYDLFIHKGQDENLHLMMLKGIFGHTQFIIPMKDKEKLIKVIKSIK